MAGGLLDGVDQLPQVLDGVDVVMGGGGDSVGALRDHAGTGHIRADLGAGQVPADARLGPLAHLDLHRGACLHIVPVDAEAAGGHLYNGVGTVDIEVLVETALAGVVVDAQFL